MKRADLIARLLEMGCQLIRHGGRHDFYRQPASGRFQPVPRHRELNEHLARKILRYLDPGNHDG